MSFAIHAQQKSTEDLSLRSTRAAYLEEDRSPLLELQRNVGNQAVQHLFRSISNPDDPEEQEADNVANTIMLKAAGAPCSCAEGGEMCEECRQKQSQPIISRRASAPSAPAHVPRIVGDVLRSPGHPLDAATRSFFEPRFGRDFGHVRIHTDSSATESARSIHAHAYTAGSDIVFAPGQYSPATDAGRSLLAHELTHVVQQDAVEHMDSGFTNSSAPPISRNSSPIIRRNIFGDAWDALGDAADWVGDKIEAGAGAVWDGTKWVAGKAKKVAVAVGEWAWDKMKNAWNCLIASGHATYNVLTMNVSSLADLLGVEEPTGDGPVFLKYLDMVLNHPCIRAIPGIGDAAGALNKVISFLYTAWNIIQNPEPVFEAIRNALSKLIKAVVVEAESKVKKALDSLGAKLKRHGEGVWRHLEPKLQYLANNWWDVIKETAWTLLWPWPSVAKDLSTIWDHIKSAADNLSNLNFSKGIDDILAVERGVLSIAGSLYGWFAILAILVGAIFGGGLPGAAAGAAVAAAVGEGLLAATVLVESASLVKAVYNLAQGESDDDQEKDYEQISSSGLTLAITGVMFLLSELAVKFAQGLLSRVPRLFGRRGPKPPAIEAPVKGGAIDSGSGAKSFDLSPESLESTNKSLGERIEDPSKLQEHPDLTKEDTLDKTAKRTTEASDAEPRTDEIHEPLDENGGDARVTEEGHCKICHSPCKRIVQMAREALNALWESSARQYAENLAMRAQLLDDAMEAAIKRGTFRTEYEPRFSKALKKLGNEIDGVHRRVVLEDTRAKAPALDEIESFGPGRREGIMDNPENYDPTRHLERAERGREGTQYHTKVEDAVVASLQPETAFTENTIQDFLTQKFGIDPATLPKKSTGIDLYIIDHQRNLVTPVDITNVAGGRAHVAKLHTDVARIRAAFERAGYHMSEPIEIEYVGQTFNQASKRISDELRPFAHQ